MNGNPAMNRSETVRLQRRSLAVGIVAIIFCVAGGIFAPAQFFRAYLAAFLFFLGIPLGSLVLLLVYQLTGGAWGFLLRRVLEAGMKTIPLFVPLFLPIAFGLKILYPWAQPEAVAASEKLQYQQFYLAPTYFWIRAAIYFLLWLSVVFLLQRRFGREESGRSPPAKNHGTFSGLAAVVYGITIHFAAIDWAMSLQPTFHSTIWGPLIALGQLLSAFAFAIVVLSIFVDHPPLAEAASRNACNDLGSLLFTLLILWSYLAWFQFMLIWIANMRVDVVWQHPRSSGGWLWVVWAIAVFHFAVPFFALLMKSVKRNMRRLAFVAGLLLFMQLVFMHYLILPGFREELPYGHVMDFITPIAIGGIWLAYYLHQLQKQPLLPANDPNRAAAEKLRRLDEEEAAHEAAAEEYFAHE